MRRMRIDLHFYGTVPIHDPGAGPPEANERRASNEQVVECYRRLERWAQRADRYDFDTLWLTEHHFQHEGYEVTPNLILMGTYLAARTTRLRFGQMFNVVPQWHPLRLAEDFAMADILTGGRLVFGVGRGTVPREAQNLGSVVASGDNDLSADADRLNREIFAEAMEVIKAAWAQERFSYAGKHFTFPVAGIPDRGRTVTELTLVPRPISYPIEIYQPVSSPRTLEYVAAQGHIGVFAMSPYEQIAAAWERFGEVAAANGRYLEPGEGRVLQIPIHLAATSAEAKARARDAHDEYVKFLAPYGRFAKVVPGAPFDYRPSLEETVASGTMAIGSVEEVLEVLGRFAERLSLRHLVLFPELPGLAPEVIDEQIDRIAEELMPQLNGRRTA